MCSQEKEVKFQTLIIDLFYKRDNSEILERINRYRVKMYIILSEVSESILKMIP
jgi:hypothetical protein